MDTESIDLLEKILFRLALADTDDKFERIVNNFLTPILLKIDSPNPSVREKVVEVLTHINKRLKSRSEIKLPMEDIIKLYNTSQSMFQLNFTIIYVVMGFPRLTMEDQIKFGFQLIKSLETKPENHQDKIFSLVVPMLGEINKINFEQKKKLVDLDDVPVIKNNFLMFLRDVLILPYGITKEAETPLGMSKYGLNRVLANDWSAETLENMKLGITELLCGGVFEDREIYILLVIASADTRFRVASPALSESSKIGTTIDFTDSDIFSSFYDVLLGKKSNDPNKCISSCNSRIGQKILLNLIKVRGQAMNTTRGIQVVFEGLFGKNINKKCKILSLKFCENLIKFGSINILNQVAKVILNALNKIIAKDSEEPVDVQNATYLALGQLARSCPAVFNQDLKIVLSYFNNLKIANPELHGPIKDTLISIAPSFACKTSATNFVLSPQLNLLLAMLRDNVESDNLIVLNATREFLTICFPEYFPESRYLLLIIAGKRNSIYETILFSLYGSTTKDHINYSSLTSKDSTENDSESKICLPSFNDMVNYVSEVIQKYSYSKDEKKSKVIPFNSTTFEEILEYLRLCLWFTAGLRDCPDNEANIIKNSNLIRNYILSNYENNPENPISKYLNIINLSIGAERTFVNVKCLYDLLNAHPKHLCPIQLHIIDLLALSLKNVSEPIRIQIAQTYGLLLSYGIIDDFENKVMEQVNNLASYSIEHRHGTILLLGNAIHHKILLYKEEKKAEFQNWILLHTVLKIVISSMSSDQNLIVSAGIKSLSLIGALIVLPNLDYELPKNIKMSSEEATELKNNVKFASFHLLSFILRDSSQKTKLREQAALCLGSLANGDSDFYSTRVLNKFLNIIKLQKDAVINIAIGNAFAMAINSESSSESSKEKYLKEYLKILIKLADDPNPHSRESVSVWLLSIVKNCSNYACFKDVRIYIQIAFTSLLADNSEFVQDVSSRGLGLLFSMADKKTQDNLANDLLNQMIGGKRSVNLVDMDTTLFPEGMLGKTPTGGNITTYKELCSLASDLNKPDLVYQFMQLANNNATWTSKLGAAFGLQSLSIEDKSKLEPYMRTIVPRLFRYKYDPTPKIQNSMISIWDSIVKDSSIDAYYWDIMKEILENITFNEWRIRIACCLAVRDLLKRKDGLKLRVDTENTISKDVPEPELKDLWFKLFRVMDDVHEGTRLAAKGTTELLGKLCSQTCSSDNRRRTQAVVKTIIPFILETGITHIVPEIRQISIKTLTEIINTSESLIVPQLKNIVPALLIAAGELESSQLSYLSTRLEADSDAQETVDTLRAESIKNHKVSDAIGKCIRYIDANLLEEMTPAIIDISKSSVNLGSRIACAHFISMISIHLGSSMQFLVGRYLKVCLTGINDRNPTIRKYFAKSIGNLIGIAKDASIKNLFTKFQEIYFENPHKGIPAAIFEINNKHPELLKDYFENILPLIFFAIHEEVSEETKSTVEMWKQLWDDISPGDAGISSNLNQILELITKNIVSEKWDVRVQSGAAINTIFMKLNHTIDKELRLTLINYILNAIHGRLFKSKDVFLKALVSASFGIRNTDEISKTIMEAVMNECKRKDIQYKTKAIEACGKIAEELEVDAWEEFFGLVSSILDSTDFQSLNASESKSDLSAQERIDKAIIFNNLKETVCISLGRCWPKKSVGTQNKFQFQFLQKCEQCIVNSTRQVQIACLIALSKFTERIHVFDKNYDPTLNEYNLEKTDKINLMRNISTKILEIVSNSVSINNTSIKQECLTVLKSWLNRVLEEHNKSLIKVGDFKVELTNILKNLQKDNSPSLVYNVEQFENNLITNGFVLY